MMEMVLLRLFSKFPIVYHPAIEHTKQCITRGELTAFAPYLGK